MPCIPVSPAEMPEGKFMTTVKIGPRGQIVIPKEARELLGLHPGDNLLLLTAKDRGIALLPQEHYMKLFRLFDHVLPINGSGNDPS